MSDGSPFSLIPKEVIGKFYDDTISPSAKKVGKIAAGAIEAFTYLLDPAIKALIDYPDRMERDLKAVVDSVPPERRVEAEPEIAGPVFEKLRYLTDSNSLKSLYLNLLKAAIDSERRSEVHRRFVSILAEISVDEAMIFSKLSKLNEVNCFINTHGCGSEIGGQFEWGEAVDQACKLIPFSKQMSTEHRESAFETLVSFGLIRFSQASPQPETFNIYDHAAICVTEFGKRFAKVCLPDTTDID
jgi:hypothetical protein